MSSCALARRIQIFRLSAGAAVNRSASERVRIGVWGGAHTTRRPSLTYYALLPCYGSGRLVRITTAPWVEKRTAARAGVATSGASRPTQRTTAVGTREGRM